MTQDQLFNNIECYTYQILISGIFNVYFCFNSGTPQASGHSYMGGTPLHQDLSPPHSEDEDSVATICGFGDEFHDLKV